MQRVERIVYLPLHVRLLTHPANDDHGKLCKAIDAALTVLRQPEVSEPAVRVAVEHMARLSQGILKREWERVKAGT